MSIPQATREVVFRELTAVALATAGRSLDDLVVQSIFAAAKAGGIETWSLSRLLSTGLRALFLTAVGDRAISDAGIQNGFDQYLDPELWHLTLEGYRAIGAVQKESVLRRALVIFEGPMDGWSTNADDFDGDAPTYVEGSAAIEELDDEFYAAEPPSYEARIRYAKEHAAAIAARPFGTE